MNLYELEDEFRAIPKKMKADIVSAVADSLRVMLAVAQEVSSGPYSSAALKAMGHPFARRHAAKAKPPGARGRYSRRDEHVRLSLNPGIINPQTGDFFMAWTPAPIRETGNTIGSYIWNDDPKAKFLESGTRFMVERPVAKMIYDRSEMAVYDILMSALER